MWQHLREARPSEYHEAKLPGESSHLLTQW